MSNNTNKSNKNKQIYGYCRVSTKEQNLDRQLIAMREEGVPEENIFSDKKSGKDFNRTEWKKLYNKCRAGDTLIIMSIDRLGRDYDAIGRTWKRLTNTKKVNIKVLDMPILNTTNNTLVDKLLSDIILQLLAYVAQTERDNLLKRQAQGIAAAKARGVHFGRPEVNVPKDFKKIVRDWEDKEISYTEAVELSGLSTRTFYRKAEQYKRKI